MTLSPSESIVYISPKRSRELTKAILPLVPGKPAWEAGDPRPSPMVVAIDIRRKTVRR
jgi:hypothetical protein